MTNRSIGFSREQLTTIGMLLEKYLDRDLSEEERVEFIKGVLTSEPDWNIGIISQIESGESRRTSPGAAPTSPAGRIANYKRNAAPTGPSGPRRNDKKTK